MAGGCLWIDVRTGRGGEGILLSSAAEAMSFCAAAFTLSLLLLLGCLVGRAEAAEVTRDSYREAVEPICKENTQANERILHGVRTMVRHEKLEGASRRFLRAARALRGTLSQLRPVPRPPRDVSRLSRWLGFVSTEAELLANTGHYLAAGRRATAEGMVVRLESTARRANNVVFAFEFKYCRFEPSRFT